MLNVCFCVSGTFRRCEHVGVEQRSLEASASLCRQVCWVVPVLGLVGPRGPGPSGGHNHSSRGVRVTVAGLTWGTDALATGMPDLLAMLKVVGVAIVTVCPTVYLEDDGAQCDQETDTDASEEHQSCPLRLVCERKNKQTNQSLESETHKSLPSSWLIFWVFYFPLLAN